MSTLKASGHPCPKCREPFPAEHAQLHQPARWTCHGCGATGELTGSMTIRSSTDTRAPAPVKGPLPASRNLGRSR